MKPVSLYNDIASTSYPGRGIVIGKSADGSKAVIAYFIMGRSENSRNRIFVETEDGIKTQAFDESKLIDPSLIIYSPVRKLDNNLFRIHQVNASWIALTLLYVTNNFSELNEFLFP